MLRCIHIHKRRPVLSCRLATSAELRETGTVPLLGKALVGCHAADISVFSDEPGQATIEEPDLGDRICSAEMRILSRRIEGSWPDKREARDVVNRHFRWLKKRRTWEKRE